MLQAYPQVNHKGMRINLTKFSNSKTRTHQRDLKITEVYCDRADNLLQIRIKVLIFNGFEEDFIGIIYVLLILKRIDKLVNEN
ncbi:MAG: hypothetical protein ACTMUB_01925 [cyanobacterium endosymbiont of Rhopalodia musculus]|uniref:hypothetical protein n=1 Tax=cyanobacterium endosymbiont of Epithemia clementina EcSB TaxID=3034674 RepID=UPI0024814A9C|nr:hypothetical protein [cyanobacterium endosymbiont of Epithemia clementina EcSB]WGT66997.1 hypothetical protein P3F56_07105 [cyanobacterium endosymbiont of Epithemia clementina EcSB]